MKGVLFFVLPDHIYRVQARRGELFPQHKQLTDADAPLGVTPPFESGGAVVLHQHLPEESVAHVDRREGRRNLAICSFFIYRMALSCKAVQ